jgi:homoserine/homoserine lactone efflux protein
MIHLLNLWRRSTVCAGEFSMDLHSFALYVLTEGALSRSPGPAVMLDVAYGITASWSMSVFSILGILATNAI